MNLALPKLARLAPALAAISLHLVIILLGGYFLSPEFTIYPFLASRGFLPYVNIIDQHFPSLVFGPLSFPSWLTTNPFPLLIVFGALTVLTDLFFYLSLVRQENKRPLSWLLVWIVASYWFSGNILWMESFITFFLTIIYFLGKNDHPHTSFLQGSFFAMILLVKPTLLPLLILLFLYRKLVVDGYLLIGFSLPLLITALFLFRFNLVPAFLELTITFNRQFYAKYAVKLPTVRQIIETSIVFLPGFFLFLRQKKILPLLLIVSSAVLVYPRFEYTHLQPALLLLILLLARELKLVAAFLVPFCLVLLTFFVYRNLRHHYGNYWLDQDTRQVASELKSRPGSTLYVLGGNELLYPLTNRIPPGLTYLPSLPWYWKNEAFAKRVVSALSGSPQTLILAKKNATIDGVNIEKNTGLIGTFIKDYYQPVETIGSYQVYQRK
jgi:hypothetical protein